jgi:spermidine/putrescine transport system permease protein
MTTTAPPPTAAPPTDQPAAPPPRPRSARRRVRMRNLAPYWMVLPGWLWLAIFFVIPIVIMLSVSTMTGNIEDGFKQTWHFSNYSDAWSAYHVQFVRSLIYGAIATALCILIGYPVAYWIAFRGGAHKSSLLFLLLLPFFVSFVIRTQSWNFILSDNGMVVSRLRDWGWVDSNFHILQTPVAVIGGLTYNFIPFMILPIYVSLERVDLSLLEASADLYANKFTAFFKVVFPLSIPGVFAGVLLTFVPVASDYVNASILGGSTGTTMIGNIIQTQYFTNLNYPTAAAISFILMAILLVGVFLYARLLGTEDVLEAAGG